MEAAFDGSKEIAFTILSMTLVAGGRVHSGAVHGRHRRSLAARVLPVTIGVAILVSGFVSISLTPMLCSRFLKLPHATRHGWLYNAIERMFDGWLRCTIGRCG